MYNYRFAILAGYDPRDEIESKDRIVNLDRGTVLKNGENLACSTASVFLR